MEVTDNKRGYILPSEVYEIVSKQIYKESNPRKIQHFGKNLLDYIDSHSLNILDNVQQTEIVKFMIGKKISKFQMVQIFNILPTTQVELGLILDVKKYFKNDEEVMVFLSKLHPASQK